MKHLNAVVINVDVIQVIESLQHVVAGIKQHLAAWMVVDAIEEHFERHPIVQVFARMNFVAAIDTCRFEGIQNRAPAQREFIEGGFDQAGGSLRPRVKIGPGERAGKRCMVSKTQVLRRFRRQQQLIDRPCLSCGGIATYLGRRKTIEHLVVSRMNGNQLTLQMRGQLGQLQSVIVERGPHVVAIGFALRRLCKIKQAAIPARHLHTDEAQARGPLRDVIQGIEWRLIAGKLREKNRRAFDCLHCN
jgi:hypothetical protein